MREIVIAGRVINDSEPCYVIAELGNNHGGNPDVARDMCQAAAHAGASVVKFQIRDNARLYTQSLLTKPYENEHSFGRTYGEHRAMLELPAWRMSASAYGLLPWFATCFDESGMNELACFGGCAIKIASGGLTDRPLLESARLWATTRQWPVILSTGGGTIEDIDRAHDILGDCPHAILHCTASYPLKPEEANLRMILTLRNRYPETVIGYSCHSPGIAFSLIAYAFGARIIEKHFTLDRSSKGTDHAFSLEPKGLATLVDDLGKLRVALGDGVKRFYQSEVAPIAKMRRVQTDEGWKIAG